jgi:hypothetical protein
MFFMSLKNWVALFLLVSFVLHGIAFTIIAMKRRRAYYFFLTGTFVFLSAIYLIKFEGWELSVPGTQLPATWLLRIGATLCTLIYLRSIYRVEGTWLWKLTRKKRKSPAAE